MTRRVLAFGVFDGLHPGHLAFLRQAKRLGGTLVVVVTRDAVVLREKGKHTLLTERERVELVRAVRMVDSAVLGDPPERYFSVIRRLRPAVIALGYDQRCDLPAFRATLASLGLSGTRVVRCRARQGHRLHHRLLRAV